jgi:Fe-S-cluster-containing dehydrogenase component
MSVAAELDFFIDPSRCIGCQACVHACSECDTHRGEPMIHLEYVDREASTQTTPVVCMHCEDPACAKVCPADAIKKTPDGIVQSALRPRCIGCSNCVLACPFGVPRYVARIDQMMKCDMCYDRTSVGKKPMCASVCPSGALAFGRRDEMAALRRERSTNVFVFGPEVVKTRVQLMVPAGQGEVEMDITAFMER